MNLDEECKAFERQMLHYLAQITYLTGEDLTPSQQDAVTMLGVKAFREYMLYFRKDGEEK